MVRNNLFQATKVVTFFQSAKYFHTFFHPPAGASLQLVPNSKFKIHKKTLAKPKALPKLIHLSFVIIFLFETPLVQACSLCPIQNSKFTTQLRFAPLPFGVVGELAQPSMSNGGEELNPLIWYI